VRLYWELARRGYGRYAAYPAATFAGIWTNTIFGFLQAYILLALYENRTDIGGYEPTDAVTYVWFAQGLLATLWAFGWYEVALRIRTGDIATDLARPLDPLRYWLAFDLGRAGYHLVLPRSSTSRSRRPRSRRSCGGSTRPASRRSS
jgi:ABC-2 type transport system permease protein